MKKLIFAILIGLFFIQCADETINADAHMIYAETQCSDPWHDRLDELGLAGAVIEYLDENVEAPYYNLTASPDTAFFISCNACVCLSGRQIEIDVESENVSLFEEVGFQEQ